MTYFESQVFSALLPLIDRLAGMIAVENDPAVRHSIGLQAAGVIQSLRALQMDESSVRMAEDRIYQASRKASRIESEEERDEA